MKTKVLFTILFFCTFLDATIVETIIFENPNNKAEVALFGSVHDENGEGQFVKIVRNILRRNAPLLILNEDCLFYDYSKVKNPLLYGLLNYKFITNSPFMTELVLRIGMLNSLLNDVVLSRLDLLNFYNYFPYYVTYNAIDYRLFSRYYSYFYNFFELSNSFFKQVVSGKYEEAIIEDFAQKVESVFDKGLHPLKPDALKNMFKEIPLEVFKNPSIETVLLIFKIEIQRLSKMVIPAEIKHLFLSTLGTLEKKYFKLHKHFCAIFTKDELKMPCPMLFSSIIRNVDLEKNVNMMDIFIDVCTVTDTSVLLDLEVLYRIYTTDHKKIAVFAGADHTKNLTQWLQSLGWSIVHKTECDDKNGVPSSDFDFLK